MTPMIDLSTLNRACSSVSTRNDVCCLSTRNEKSRPFENDLQSLSVVLCILVKCSFSTAIWNSCLFVSKLFLFVYDINSKPNELCLGIMTHCWKQLIETLSQPNLATESFIKMHRQFWGLTKIFRLFLFKICTSSQCKFTHLKHGS